MSVEQRLHEVPCPVTNVRLLTSAWCTGCACTPGQCIFLAPKSATAPDCHPITNPDFSPAVVSMWRGVFCGRHCVNSMVSFFCSWYFVCTMVSLARHGQVGSSDEAHAMSLIRLLVGKGANVDAQWIIGRTALFAAAFEGRVEMMQLLVQLGADVNRRDASGLSVLSCFRLTKVRNDMFLGLRNVDREVVLCMIRAGLRVSIMEEWVDGPRGNANAGVPLVDFVEQIIPQVKRARRAMFLVLLANKASPSSLFYSLPGEMMKAVTDYVWASQTEGF